MVDRIKESLPRGEMQYRVLEALIEGPQSRPQITRTLEVLFHRTSPPLRPGVDAWIWRFTNRRFVEELIKTPRGAHPRARFFQLTELGKKELTDQRERRGLLSFNPN